MLLFFSFFNDSSLTYSSSALLLCFLRHLVSQLLWNRGTENACVGLRNKSIFQIKPKLSDKCGENKQTNKQIVHCASVTYLLETVAVCTSSIILEGPRSKSGRLVGPEKEYMAGRQLSSLLGGAG